MIVLIEVYSVYFYLYLYVNEKGLILNKIETCITLKYSRYAQNTFDGSNAKKLY